MISFSRTVKEEVVFNDFDVPSSKALLSAIIAINGILLENTNTMNLTIRSENAKIISKVHRMIKELYQPKIEFLVSKRMKLKKNNIYSIKITQAEDMLKDLSLLSKDEIKLIPDENMINSDITKRAYLAGAFLSSGSVNNPETSNYHLELSLSQKELAEFIMDLMNQFDLHAKIIKRRNKEVVYLKSSEKIGDFLRAIGAGRSVMEFESTRINRNMSNTVNRWNNCDIANEIKTMASAMKQIEDIHVIQMFRGYDMLELDEKTRRVALIRLEYPELSLSELAIVYEEETGESISRSGLHRRLQKIKNEADRLRQLESERYGEN